MNLITSQAIADMCRRIFDEDYWRRYHEWNNRPCGIRAVRIQPQVSQLVEDAGSDPVRCEFDSHPGD